MAALDQHRAGAEREQLFRLRAHLGFRRAPSGASSSAAASARLGVTHAHAPDQVAQRPSASSRSSRSPELATITGSSTTLRRAIAVERGGDNVDRRRVGEHADLHRADIEIGEHRVDLRGDKVRRHIMDGEDALGVLRRQRGDDAGAIDAERGKGFQIRLDAGAAARIRAGDGQGDGNAHRSSLRSPLPAGGKRLADRQFIVHAACDCHRLSDRARMT